MAEFVLKFQIFLYYGNKGYPMYRVFQKRDRLTVPVLILWYLR